MVYDELIDRVGLGDIRDKVLAGERLQADDGLRLYACDEFPILGYLANIVRERKNGAATYYVRNQHINYTNVCNKLCRFCSFYVKPRDERGYVLSPEDVQERVMQHIDIPLAEIHMVAGINPTLPYSYYLDIVRAVKEVRPDGGEADLVGVYAGLIEQEQQQRVVRVAKTRDSDCVVFEFADSADGPCLLRRNSQREQRQSARRRNAPDGRAVRGGL